MDDWDADMLDESKVDVRFMRGLENEISLKFINIDPPTTLKTMTLG